eukprot:scaffold2009_cov370-Prasinococcus_capsulatus_cf.AAC.9
MQTQGNSWREIHASASPKHAGNPVSCDAMGTEVAAAETRFAEAWLDRVLAASVLARSETQPSSRDEYGDGLLSQPEQSPRARAEGYSREHVEIRRDWQRCAAVLPAKSPGCDPYASLHTGQGGLRVCGIGRADLELAGLTPSSIDRLYRALYVHSIGFHRLLTAEAGRILNGYVQRECPPMLLAHRHR